MNKDTVVASVIGFGLGLVAAIALWVVPRVFPAKHVSPASTETVSASPTTSDTTAFTLSTPVDGQITQDSSVKIEGTAKKDSTIVVSTTTGSTTITPDDGGKFSTKVDLSLGANDITVADFGDSTEESKELFVYYYQDQI
jgi:hypothetical protein